jgi:hypothetical protein
VLEIGNSDGVEAMVMGDSLGFGSLLRISVGQGDS